MKFNRILSSALLVVMIFMTCVAVLPITASAAYSSETSGSANLSVQEIAKVVQDSYKQYYTKEPPLNYVNPPLYASANEKLQAEIAAGYINSVKYGDYTLYVNKYTGNVYYKNDVTGQILTSNPYNYFTEKDTNKEWLSSQIVISYSEITVGTEKLLFSTIEAAERGQISTDFIKNGIRVNYTLGDTSSRYLLPVSMPAADFEKNVLCVMLNRLANAMELYCNDTTGEYNIFENPDYNVDEDKNSANKENLYYHGYINYRVVRKYLSKAEGKYKSLYKDKNSIPYNEIATLIADIRSLYATGNGYSLKNLAEYDPDSKNYEDMLATYYSDTSSEIYDTKEAIYVFPKGAENNMKYIASLTFKKYYPACTFMDVRDYEEYCGYKDESKQNPVFRCAVEYSFDEDGALSVRLPANSITFDKEVYNLSYISVLPYFGSASVENDGYVFFPDGSGTVMEFSDFYDPINKLNINPKVIVDIYGKDYCYSNITGAHREQITMPVYGMVSSENSVKNGFFAVLEEGASLASISLEMDTMATQLAHVFTYYKPYPSDVYDLSETISVGSSGFYTIVAEDSFNGSYVTKYTMLTDPKLGVAGGYETSYVGMANCYRDYLYKNGTLTELDDVRKNLPLYVEALGSMEIISKFLSFPVTKKIALTEFADISKMYEQLRDSVTLLNEIEAENRAASAALQAEIDALSAAITNATVDVAQAELQIAEKTALKAQYDSIADTYKAWAADFKIDNINFRLTGFGHGGLYNTYPTKLRWNRACGGKSEFKELIENAKEAGARGENLGIYPEFDFMYISNTAAFDGVSKKANAAKMIDNRYASKQVYDSVSREYVSYFTLVINTETLDELYAKFSKKYSKYDISNISVSTLGSDLNSNFDEDAPVIRDKAQAYISDLLNKIANEDKYNVMLDIGNDYTLGYASHILNVNTDSSHFRYSSYPVPFVGMVLHGSVNYAGTPINYSGNPSYDLLRSIESGASLYYILCYQNSNYMKEDILLNDYYGIDYANWYKSIVKTYAELNYAIGSLQDYKIVDHKILTAERVIDPKEENANIAILMKELVSILEEKILVAKDEKLDSFAGAPGRILNVAIDRASVMNSFADILNIDNIADMESLIVEDKKTFGSLIDAIITKYTVNLAGSTDTLTVDGTYFTDIGGKATPETFDDYISAHSFITDSLATDENYVYTDFTINRDVVLVTYENAEGNRVQFLLNYNIYTVEVALEAGEPPISLPKYSYKKI